MNQENVPIKYTIGIWKTLPSYPTKVDVLYEVYHYLFKNGKTEFSEQTLNSVWFDQSGTGSWKNSKIEEHVQSLIKDETFKEIKKVNEKSWYIINETNNPFL